MNKTIIKEWKEGIRDTLISVKMQFVDWIENFTNKFVKSLNKIEQSRDLINFVGEDKRQEMRILDMQNKSPGHVITFQFLNIRFITKHDTSIISV